MTTLEHIITQTNAHLQPGETSKWQGRCPNHDDKTPSLSISVNDAGIGLYCHACGKDATPAIAEALGLTMSDLFTKPKEKRRAWRQPDAVYPYHDVSGALLFEVCRFNLPGGDKEFRQRRPDGQGGHVWKLGDTKRVLYHLPELLAADLEQWVYLCEGEKSTDAIRSLGLVATCNAGGAGKWRTGYSQALQGRKVCILADNDEPGHKHARSVARALHDLAADVRVLTLVPDMAKGDPFDWCANGGTRDNLLAMTEGAGPFVPAPDHHSYTRTDTGNAERLVTRHGADLRYCYPWSTWLVWDGRRWKADNTGEPHRRAKETARSIFVEAANASSDTRAKALAKWALDSLSQKRLKAMLESARCELPILPDALDADPWLMAVNNGVLDLRTGELSPHDPGHFITKLAPVDYDPDAPAPTWAAFLDKIMAGNENLISFLQRAAGYSLTGSTRERVLFILWGTGDNGKSTLIETLRAALGDGDGENGYAIRTSIEVFMRQFGTVHPCDKARLKGARLITASESEEGRRFAESFVKDFTGGDTITARRMRENPWQFKPVGKPWIATNHKPVIKGTDHAIWRRIRLIPFTVTIPEAEQDKELPNRLRAELPGILAWAVQGCMAWQRDGLGVPDEVRAATDEYKAEMDVLGPWLEDCCILKPDAWATVKDLKESYNQWCEANGEKPLSWRKLSDGLRERGVIEKQVYGQGRGRLGIGLTDDSIPQPYRIPLHNANSTIDEINENPRETIVETAVYTGMDDNSGMENVCPDHPDAGTWYHPTHKVMMCRKCNQPVGQDNPTPPTQP